MIHDVIAFQRKFNHLLPPTPNHLTRRKLRERIECIREELTEFVAACDAQDLAAQADALIDLIYFALGTINMLGMYDAFHPMWAEVQRTNMAKVSGVGKRGHAVDCIKPPEWRPPSIDYILRIYGYDPAQQEFRDDDYVGPCDRV